jgi:hypothetical protein
MRVAIGLAALAFTAACAANPKPAINTAGGPPVPPGAASSTTASGTLTGKTYACTSPAMSMQLIVNGDQYETRNAAKGAKTGKGKLKIAGDTLTPLTGPLVGQVGTRTKTGYEFEAELAGAAKPLTCTAS